MDQPKPEKNSALSKLKRQFLEYLEVEKNDSVRTIRAYDFYLTRFFAISGAREPRDITADRVREFRLDLNRLAGERGEALKKSTQNYHLIALRSFLKYLAKRDVKALTPEKIELAKMPERQVDFLDADDVERIMAAPAQTREARVIKLRDTAILEMLFSTGLRVSELAGLKREQINPKRSEITVRGKGGKLRVVFLSADARSAAQAYVSARRDMEPALFVRHDRAAKGMNEVSPLTTRSIERLVQHYAKAAGITKHVTPHTLRHSYATDLLINGADIRSVQAMLGHASITTTQIYTHVTNQQLKDVHAAFHARRRKK